MGKTLLLLFMTLAPVCAAFAADNVPCLPAVVSQEARNKAVAGRVFEEIFNQGNFQVADEIYAEDFVNHGLHRNIDLQEDQAAVHAEKKAFPDLMMTVTLMVAEGDLVTKGQRFGTIESVKSVSDLYAPVTGTVTEINEALNTTPEDVNKDAHGAWMIKVTLKDAAEVGKLMSAADYEAFAAAEGSH